MKSLFEMNLQWLNFLPVSKKDFMTCCVRVRACVRACVKKRKAGEEKQAA